MEEKMEEKMEENMLTVTQKDLEPIKIDITKIIQVYSGIDGACCCGCSGKHTYMKSLQAKASKERGYPVTDDECSERTVKMIVNKMNKNSEKIEEEVDFYSLVLGTRLYVAYKNL